jgi:hypothetical protein
MKRQWQIHRQFQESADAARRWDRVFQHLLQWSPPIEPRTILQRTTPSHPQSEVSHDNSHLCPRVDRSSSPRPSRLHIGLHKLGRHEFDRMSLVTELARPVMGPTTGLHADGHWGSCARKGTRAWRVSRLRHTILPVMSVPTRWKIFWPDRCRRCTRFASWDSSPRGYMMSACTDLIVAEHSRSA